MNELDRLSIFEAQTENVRELATVRKHLRLSVNKALRTNDNASVEVHTKCLALVFCAWVEANFSKLIHTPHGFTLDEIAQIKQNGGRSRSVEEGWAKAIELGLRRVESGAGFVQNRRQEIIRLVQRHVVEPSLIRNKIAHGQWQVALNRTNTAQNVDLTTQIAQLDVVQIEKWFRILTHLTMVLRKLIESPTKAFHRDYWIHVADLQKFLVKSAGWTLADKKRRLVTKESYRPPIAR